VQPTAIPTVNIPKNSELATTLWQDVVIVCFRENAVKTKWVQNC